MWFWNVLSTALVPLPIPFRRGATAQSRLRPECPDPCRSASGDADAVSPRHPLSGPGEKWGKALSGQKGREREHGAERSGQRAGAPNLHSASGGLPLETRDGLPSDGAQRDTQSRAGKAHGQLRAQAKGGRLVHVDPVWFSPWPQPQHFRLGPLRGHVPCSPDSHRKVSKWFNLSSNVSCLKLPQGS